MLEIREESEEAVPLKVKVIIWINENIQQVVFVIPQSLLKQARAMRYQMPAFRMKRISGKIAEAAQISSRREASISLKAGRDVAVHRIKFHVA